MTSDALAAATLMLGAGSGAWIDMRTRRIPNAIVGMTLLAGLVWAVTGLTGVSPGSAVAGTGLGLTLMLPGHYFGATGAGDVKLFAAAGAVLGIERVPQAFLATLIAGGVLAVGFALARGRLKATIRRVRALVTRSELPRPDAERRLDVDGFPYGPAIAVGTLWSVLL